MALGSATFKFPVQPTERAYDKSLRKPSALHNFADRAVLGSKDWYDAQGFHLGSIAWQILIIVLDSLLIWDFTSTPAWEAGPGPGITVSWTRENEWGLALAATMVGLTTSGMIVQGVNMVIYRYSRWPVTAFVWGTQLLGFALATAILGYYLNYPHSDEPERNNKLGVAIGDLVARTIYISVQLGTAAEYLTRPVPDPDMNPKF